VSRASRGDWTTSRPESHVENLFRDARSWAVGLLGYARGVPETCVFN
jgi:hypothetical protein